MNTIQDRINRLPELFARIERVPKEWTNGKILDNRVTGVETGNEDCLPCYDYRTVQTAWRKALKWRDGLDNALCTMLAAAMSTNFVGEQLWIKIIGPPSCGKTTLLEGLALNKRYVVSKSTIRGFHSGWKTDDGEDMSLAHEVRGRTLATKDGDTLLKAPNFREILAEARDIYDRVSRTHYRNATSREYTGLRMTWLLCGTASLREIDESELGARFLDCVVMDDMEEEFETEVGWRAANQELRNMRMESDGTMSSQYPPELSHAMQLTGGYLDYLRGSSVELTKDIHFDPDSVHFCNRLGKFIAIMRARPPKEKDAESDREFSPRLVKQIIRLTMATTATLNLDQVTPAVLQRVHGVGMDTSRGITANIMHRLVHLPTKGLEVRAMAAYANKTEDQVRKHLRFLRDIGVVAPLPDNHRRWRMTEPMLRLYREIVDEPIFSK